MQSCLIGYLKRSDISEYLIAAKKRNPHECFLVGYVNWDVLQYNSVNDVHNPHEHLLKGHIHGEIMQDNSLDNALNPHERFQISLVHGEQVFTTIKPYLTSQSLTPFQAFVIIFEVRRHVGMADEADSKSVVCEHVWVQVPLPAYKKPGILIRRVPGFFYCFSHSLYSSGSINPARALSSLSLASRYHS